MMGVNGIAYDTNDYSDMIDGRVLPWTQDIPEVNVWDQWDVILRDLFILDREGNMFAVINLTTFNPDESGMGECTGNYQAIKDVILEVREQ